MNRIPHDSRLDGQGPQYLMHLEHTKVVLDQVDRDIAKDRIGSAMSSMNTNYSSAWT